MHTVQRLLLLSPWLLTTVLVQGAGAAENRSATCQQIADKPHEKWSHADEAAFSSHCMNGWLEAREHQLDLIWKACLDHHTAADGDACKPEFEASARFSTHAMYLETIVHRESVASASAQVAPNNAETDGEKEAKRRAHMRALIDSYGQRVDSAPVTR